MKILLTGGSGFLGSALARRFDDDGHEVSLLMRTGSLLDRLGGRRFDVGRCMTDFEISALVRRVEPDAVIHVACSYGRNGETWSQLLDVNVRLGLLLIDAIRSLRPRDTPRLFLNTGTSLPANVSPYALSKRQFADWGMRAVQEGPPLLQFVQVELEHMYGPGDDASKFTSFVLRQCAADVPELLLTAGEQRRDFVFVDDVVDGYATLLAQAPALGPVSTVPLGSGEAPTVRSFVELAHRLTDSRTQLRFGALPYRPSEAMYCQADLGVMRGFGWEPRWRLAQGLKQTVIGDRLQRGAAG